MPLVLVFQTQCITISSRNLFQLIQILLHFEIFLLKVDLIVRILLGDFIYKNKNTELQKIITKMSLHSILNIECDN